MSFIQSLFTPSGTNASQNETNRQSSAENTLSGLLPGEVGYQQQLQSYRQSQLPMQEQAVQNAAYNTTQGGRNAQTQAYGQQQQAMANEASGNAGSKFAGNPALAQGYSLDAANQANANTGNYAAGLNSAAGENSAWGNYLATDSALSPNYSGADSLTGTLNNQPTVQVGQGLGGFLGTALGSYFGGGALSGGGSSGAAASSGATAAPSNYGA